MKKKKLYDHMFMRNVKTLLQTRKTNNNNYDHEE